MIDREELERLREIMRSPYCHMEKNGFSSLSHHMDRAASIIDTLAAENAALAEKVERLEEALRMALARHDAKIAECPIDRPRCVSKPPETCPRCFAKRNEVCGVKHDAAYRLISEVRDALPENTDGHS